MLVSVCFFLLSFFIVFKNILFFSCVCLFEPGVYVIKIIIIIYIYIYIYIIVCNNRSWRQYFTFYNLLYSNILTMQNKCIYIYVHGILCKRPIIQFLRLDTI